ncbi:hypothetical protein G9A89_003900 [Geosiphon pyriformis]|nr:hypothetical protein G9A89_003900 [Geosiphon pyriformis]
MVYTPIAKIKKFTNNEDDAQVWLNDITVYFKKLDSAVSALNHWLVLVGKDSVRILFLVNQNETILFHNKFKAKLSGHCFWFALITFGSQADLDSAILGHLAVDYKVSLLPPSKFPKMFTSYFVGLRSYAKASAPLDSSGFPFLLPLVSSPAVVDNLLVLSCLSFLESDLTKLFALVESIVKSIGSLVTTFEQFINGNLVLSSAFGLKINEILVHMSSFNRTVGKLGREVVSLKKECCIENIDMSGNLELLFIVSDEMFSNLMFLWEHESVDIKTDPFKTAEWLVGLVFCSFTLFFVIQKMLSLNKFSSVALA